MENTHVNIYNKPLKTAEFFSVLGIVLFLIVLGYYVLQPFELFDIPLFLGAAVISDTLNIFFGYLVLLALCGVGIAATCFAYAAKRSDQPKMAKRCSITGITVTAGSVLLAVWFTLTVLKLYKAI